LCLKEWKNAWWTCLCRLHQKVRFCYLPWPKKSLRQLPRKVNWKDFFSFFLPVNKIPKNLIPIFKFWFPCSDRIRVYAVLSTQSSHDKLNFNLPCFPLNGNVQIINAIVLQYNEQYKYNWNLERGEMRRLKLEITLHYSKMTQSSFKYIFQWKVTFSLEYFYGKLKDYFNCNTLWLIDNFNGTIL